MRSNRRGAVAGWAAVALLAVLLAGSAVPVLAHEDRLVADRYNVSVGFYVEPARTDEENFIDLLITDVTEDLSPVPGLEETLQVELTAGGDTTALSLYPRTDRPGYRTDVTPSVPGFHTFRIFGSIEGASVDESFDLEPVEGVASTAISGRTIAIAVVLGGGALAAVAYLWRSQRQAGREGDSGGHVEPV